MKWKHITSYANIFFFTLLWITLIKVWSIYTTSDGPNGLVGSALPGPSHFQTPEKVDGVIETTAIVEEMIETTTTRARNTSKGVEIIPGTLNYKEEGRREVEELQDNKTKIGIVIAVESKKGTGEYTRSLASMKCYAQIHGYTLLIANTADYANVCHQNHVHFRRHCMVAQLLPQFDYLMMLDADIGVLNPKRKIEEFIDPAYDITFYDRFYNDEIAIGSYIVKNTDYARDFLIGFADQESLLPKSLHGEENGILHKYVASKVFPDRPEVYEPCILVYNNSKSYNHLFAYEACIRAVLGSQENFPPHLRILAKGTGWVRDSWLANSMWSPARDFMFHGWKSRYLVGYTKDKLPFKPTHGNRANWIDPFIGEFDLEKCQPGNTTWTYDPNLISTTGNIEEALKDYRKELQKNHYRLLTFIEKFL